MLRIWLAVICAVIAQGAEMASPEMQTPHFGRVRWTDGTLRDVWGIGGSFIVGEAKLRNVQAAAFSNEGGLVFSEGRVRVLDTALTPIAERHIDGPVVLGIGAELASALAWDAGSKTLLIWDGEKFNQIQTVGIPDDAITAVERRESVAVLSTQTLQFSVALTTGQVIDTRSIETSHDFNNWSGVEPIANGWLHAWSGSRHVVIRRATGQIVYELPTPAGKQ